MQKLKKALKKLANLGSTGSKSPQKPGVGKAAQPAKKTAPVKKKSQPVVVMKKATAAPSKKGAAKKIGGAAKHAAPAAAKGKSHGKPDVKDLKKKHGVPAHAAPKAADKHVEKAKKPSQAPATAAQAPMKKAAAATAAAKAQQAAPEKAKRTEEAEPKVLKAKKEKPEEIKAPEPQADEEIVLTDAEGRRYCRVKDCDQIAAVDAYCRYHYLLFWKNIQSRKKILSEGKLSRYIEELTARYPDKYLEMLRKDLKNEKDFLAAIQELEIDDSGAENEFEDEAQSFLDEVRGMGSETGGGREEEDY